jgi:hypothetical protein
MKIGKYTAWFSSLMFLALMACREIEHLSWLALPYMLVLAGAFRLLCKELEKEDDHGKRKKQNVPYDRQDLRRK